MSTNTIAWVDDEIESLTAQILFLTQKGYDIKSYSNGYDLLESLNDITPDIILLDESMPGMTGLEVIMKLREAHKHIPVIMVTKNEEEYIMDEAIGSQIADYLIKPVNPNQVLLSIKKTLDRSRLISEKTTTDYQKEFRNLFMQINDRPNTEGWKDVYNKLIHWELEMAKTSSDMFEVIQTQKEEANSEFFKFVSQNYINWIRNPEDNDTPLMSHHLLAKKLFPLLNKDIPTVFVLIDNLRLDQWEIIEPTLLQYFKKTDEELFFSILPSTTQYSRNSIFAGQLPLDIEKKFPNEWKNDDDEGGKNLFEDKLLLDNLKRNGLNNLKVEYIKITNNDNGKQLEDNVLNILNNNLTVIVYNFVDMLSHARTEMEVLKELASDEASYRSLTKSWFEHSPLLNALKKLQSKKVRIVISTDHGTKRVKNPSKVVGDRATTTNLRYKHGRNLQFRDKDVFSIHNPHQAGLPQPNVNSKFIFAKEDYFLCYPNNYNYYANYYKNTFQHGGISLEEIIVPFVVLENK